MKWDERYAGSDYVYGKEPNLFLKEKYNLIPKGRVLSLAEGEGRNGVFLAGEGYQVTGVDSSKVGLAKAERLAEETGVSIETVYSDLSDYDMGRGKWEGIVSIFCHLPPDLRKSLCRRVVEALKPGGVFLMEAFTKDQLKYKTGGPKNIDLLYDLEELKIDLAPLEFETARKIVRDVEEGTHHNGCASVVQIVGVKR